MTTAIEIVTPTELAIEKIGFDAAILAGQCGASTIRMYRRDFAAYLAWAGSPAKALDAATLTQWRTHLASEDSSLSPNTINRMISAVKRLVKEAAQQKYCDPATAAAFEQVAGVKVKALKGKQKAGARTLITPEDMRRICEAPKATTLPGKMHKALLATLASSGCRISEVSICIPWNSTCCKVRSVLATHRGKWIRCDSF